MKKRVLFAVVFILGLIQTVQTFAQCSICTKTTQQMGDGPAEGFNTGILYLAFLPLALMVFLGVRWWRNEKKNS
ncbi:hypothetical protein [Niabella drilacis]|uniref:Uncharacterized protein n=1 Tax=Niabella drilacis (strain DSM 25811 / CCM 8410 / CCUG 62505 / LMG 26954 / E90) TaxID=1285928 RepID=A0A1G6Q2Q9_NIADE|nr:hypothetical protein [Niabella drilacis]SDC86643.1 hypothetical protein SAMN04487894_104256 [Niabella drilacis]